MLERILKEKVSSVLGALTMAASIAFMITGHLSVQWDGTIVFGIGFILLFMKDALPPIIKKALKKKVDGINDKS
jgi:hypothetical protein